MAGNARNQTQSHGFADNAPRHEVVEEFDIPNHVGKDGDNLWSVVTKDFGSIRVVGVRLLTPLQEKYATQASKGDGLQLQLELARRSVAYVKSDVGGREETFRLAEDDGSSASCWAQMHPRIRLLCIQAFLLVSVPNERTQDAFLASRRIIAG